MDGNATGWVELSTEPGCGLAIGGWPRFAYNASGGGGRGESGTPQGSGSQRESGPDQQGLHQEHSWLPLRFAAERLTIPPLSWRTTRVLGVPLPPGLRIALQPQRLEGRWQPASGAIELSFAARFLFTIGGSLYRAPDLLVTTTLTTSAALGRRHRALGQPLDGSGRGRLVGVAVVEPCGEAWLDRFLGLPDEALAVLRCRLVAAAA